VCIAQQPCVTAWFNIISYAYTVYTVYINAGGAFATVESVGYSCVRSRHRNLSSCLSGTQYGLSQSVLAYTHRYDIS